MGDMFGEKGHFMFFDIGSCDQALEAMRKIDIYGVLYSFFFVPMCLSDLSNEDLYPYNQTLVPMSLSCNGVTRVWKDACNGLLLSVISDYYGGVTFKCNGKWKVSKDVSSTCSGEIYGEQERKDIFGVYVRSFVCDGNTNITFIYEKQKTQSSFSGTHIDCDGKSVISTFFSPTQATMPKQPFIWKVGNHTQLN